MPARVATALAALLLLALTLAIQWHDGAYAHDLHFDSASHALSGLMIHDWIAGFSWGAPVAYVRAYHSHYPLIGIGHWPPVWYAVEAVWMLVSDTGRAQLLVLSALVTAAVATITATLTARRYGWWPGTVAGVAFVAVPLVREITGDVLLDAAVGLVCLLAMLAYARFMRTERAGDAVLFGLLAVAAILIKGNGALLALLPPLAVVIGRRWDLLRRWTFWLPMPIVGVLAGPWVVATSPQVAAGFRFGWGLDYTLGANVANFQFLYASIGLFAIVAGVIGTASVAIRPALRQDPVLVGAAAMLVATWLFQAIVPAAFQDRYLVPLLPPLLLLALATLQTRWPERRPRLVLPGVLLVTMLGQFGAFSGFGDHGFRGAAREVWARRADANPVVLIAAEDEGAAIIELALLDPHRPGLFAVRGSRLLGGGGYNQADYQPRFGTAAEAMAALDKHAIPLVLLRRSGDPSEWAHLGQLAQARAEAPDRWQLVWEDTKVTPPIQLFEIVGNGARTADTARLLALSAPRGLGGE